MENIKITHLREEDGVSSELVTVPGKLSNGDERRLMVTHPVLRMNFLLISKELEAETLGIGM